MHYMTAGLLVSVVRLVHEPSNPVKISGLDDGGGKMPRKKNAGCMFIMK